MNEGHGDNEALARLRAGNAEFVRGIAASVEPEGRETALAEAHPFAVVLGCSDSRVPPELVLGQDLGDLFVIRVAGNVAGTDELGSIEYALARWHCPLLLVLGHTECGAVAGVLDPPPAGAEQPVDVAGAGYLASLLVTVRSNVAFAALGSGAWRTPSAAADRWRLGVDANVRRTVQALSTRSDLIRRQAAAGGLRIVGAVYDVRTGCLEVLPAE